MSVMAFCAVCGLPANQHPAGHCEPNTAMSNEKVVPEIPEDLQKRYKYLKETQIYGVGFDDRAIYKAEINYIERIASLEAQLTTAKQVAKSKKKEE